MRAEAQKGNEPTQLCKWLVDVVRRRVRSELKGDSACQLQPLEDRQSIGNAQQQIHSLPQQRWVRTVPCNQSMKVDTDRGMSVRPAVVIHRPATT